MILLGHSGVGKSTLVTTLQEMVQSQKNKEKSWFQWVCCSQMLYLLLTYLYYFKDQRILLPTCNYWR